MANYVKDPNDSKKQVPGVSPYNAYDRPSAPGICTLNKTPNYVLITKTMTQPFGFFFGNSSSFAALGGDGSGKTTAANYDSDYGLVTVGTRLDIHPCAWSGSATDAGNVKFVYKSGLSTGAR